MQTTTVPPVPARRAPPGKPPTVKKTAQEIEVERLAALKPKALTDEDMKRMRRVRDCLRSLQSTERELEELKETRKLKKTQLDEAIQAVADHAHNRQLALKLF